MFDKLKGRSDGQSSLSTSDGKGVMRKSRESARKGSISPARSGDDESMKEKTSLPLETSAPPPFSTNFAGVSLHASDKIRLLQLAEHQRDAIRNSILQTWPRGIQEEREYYGSWQFKLSGYPWYPSGSDAIHARRLTRGLLATMQENGWVLYITTDLSPNLDDKDSLFFRHQLLAPAPREWFSVTFSKYDRVRLIDAPQSVVEATLDIL